jgi:hypothetical protein
MRSVEQVQLKEIPDRPHRLGSYRDRGVRWRYILDGGGLHSPQPSAHAVRHAGRGESRIAGLSFVSHGTVKKVGEQLSNLENSRLAFRKLVAQCSILVVIAGIVSWLIAT